MRIVVQIGYQKSGGCRKEGQLIQAWVNDEECSWSDGSGKYLTSPLEVSRGLLWYLWSTEVSEEDTVRISVKTSVVGMGVDENRTFESIYYCDGTAPVREIVYPGVGKRGYPLLKGKCIEAASVSEADKREADIEEFLRVRFD